MKAHAHSLTGETGTHRNDITALCSKRQRLKSAHKKRRDKPGVFSMRLTREAVD